MVLDYIFIVLCKCTTIAGVILNDFRLAESATEFDS